jgi:hypothetical protein
MTTLSPTKWNKLTYLFWEITQCRAGDVRKILVPRVGALNFRCCAVQKLHVLDDGVQCRIRTHWMWVHGAEFMCTGCWCAVSKSCTLDMGVWCGSCAH